MFYAISYIAGRATTTGTANRKTGHMSIAINAKAFDIRFARDAWVSGANGKSVTKKQLRGLTLGMSVEQFNEWVASL